MKRPSSHLVRGLGLIALLALAGCERNPLIVKRSTCPAVAVAAYTGDINLFRPGEPDLANLDAVATITDVRDDCVETPDQLQTRVTYDVIARRTDASAARQLVLPVFATLVQGGNVITAKQVAQVTVNFAAGQDRAVAQGRFDSTVSRKAASVSPEILDKINRNRKPGMIDAATDPMADPQVRAALRAASFELLLGFQLTDAQLAYNVAK